MMQKTDICWNMFFIELSARYFEPSSEYDKIRSIRSIVAEFDPPPPPPLLYPTIYIQYKASEAHSALCWG